MHLQLELPLRRNLRFKTTLQLLTLPTTLSMLTRLSILMTTFTATMTFMSTTSLTTSMKLDMNIFTTKIYVTLPFSNFFLLLKVSFLITNKSSNDLTCLIYITSDLHYLYERKI